MNACPWKQRVEIWFDGECSGQAAAAVAAHVGQCVECSKRLAELRRLRQEAVDTVKREEIGDGQFAAFMAGVRDGLQPAPPRRGLCPRWRSPSPACRIR